MLSIYNLGTSSGRLDKMDVFIQSNLLTRISAKIKCHTIHTNALFNINEHCLLRR